MSSMGVWWGYPGVYGNLWGSLRKFCDNSEKSPEIVWDTPGTQHGIAERQVKNLMYGLDQNDSTITINSPVCMYNIQENAF